MGGSQKSPGTESIHRPPGFHASGAGSTCANPNMRRDISATTAPCLRHQEVLRFQRSRWRTAMPGGVSIASLLLGYGHDGRWRILSRHRLM
jgi:hypothetical protein